MWLCKPHFSVRCVNAGRNLEDNSVNCHRPKQMSAYYLYGSELDDPDARKYIKHQVALSITPDPEKLAIEIAALKFPNYHPKSSPATISGNISVQNPDGAQTDKGHLGDETFKNLIKDGVQRIDLSPNFGTEIEGVQLSLLDDAGKNDLALLLETRGLAVFRNQDLREKGAQFSKEFGEYFGPLHIHQVSRALKNHPDLLVTYRKAGDSSRYERAFANSTSGVGWHSDISFEKYPASFSFFVALEAPESGGDTIVLDGREAYKRLSSTLQKVFETLTLVHSNHYQNLGARAAGITNETETIFTEHPLVRRHPVTNEKSLYFSRGFVQKVKGLKPTESAAILNFLHEHVLINPEFQVRATHRGTDSGTVIAWDNRILLHTPVVDFLQHETGPRHHYRITVVGEQPLSVLSQV